MASLAAVGAASVTVGSTVLAVAKDPSSISSTILAAAALVGALTALWKFLKLGELLRGTRQFLTSWNGEAARPGVEARPGFPERMANVEHKTEMVAKRTEDINHLFRGEVTSRLTLIGEAVEGLQAKGNSNGEALSRLEGRVEEQGHRISTHDQRNRQWIEELRAEVERRIVANAEDKTRVETYRAALHELGIDAQPPELPHPDPPQ